jgi:hypothetical protein
MSVTPAPSHSIVPYQTPNARALQATGTTATGFLIALGLLVLPIIGDFLRAGAFNRIALIALATAVGMAVVSVGTTYLVKLSQARGSDVPPTVAADGTTPLAPSAFIHGERATLTAIDTGPTLSDLLAVMDVLREWSAANATPHAPPLTGTDAGVAFGADAPVKRSHHAAKAPAVVAPLDVHSDS